mmetsp:Transcript_17946/g.30022  ORF Transcript_17946/g.30022 Transcript_17946/m.30022 type:complete len:326 (+) Transcript_17946:49-1026(+)
MAAFNEGRFEDVTTDVHISSQKDKPKIDDPTHSTHAQYDTSTSAYLFELAIEKNECPDFKHAVLQRHAHFHIGGLHPHPTFSFRFGTVNDEQGPEKEEPARLWAQRHIVAKAPYYVISASPLDMDASKKDRSEHYLGKVKESHGARCFTGFSCAKDNAVQNPNVCVIYDHERGAGEKKMEVGLPLPDNNDPHSVSLEADFHKVRREGAQNHSSADALPVLCLHQKDDAPEVMSNELSLQKFVIDESACATRTSTKNFQLVMSRAARANMLATSSESVKGGEEDAGVLMQMGKVDDDMFSCAYKAPFTLLQAFMICLSRFETKQAY